MYKYTTKEISSPSNKTKIRLQLSSHMLIYTPMASLLPILPYIQIGLSVLLVVAILIQKSEAGVGGSFGGSDNFNSGFHTRRGFEQKLFYTTIALAILFVLSSLLILVLK